MSKSMSWVDKRMAEAKLAKLRTSMKGRKDGFCNRYACMVPLKDRLQWCIPSGIAPGGLYYYCSACAGEFNRYDAEQGNEARCIPAHIAEANIRSNA